MWAHCLGAHHIFCGAVPLDAFCPLGCIGVILGSGLICLLIESCALSSVWFFKTKTAFEVEQWHFNAAQPAATQPMVRIHSKHSVSNLNVPNGLQRSRHTHTTLTVDGAEATEWHSQCVTKLINASSATSNVWRAQ